MTKVLGCNGNRNFNQSTGLTITLVTLVTTVTSTIIKIHLNNSYCLSEILCIHLIPKVLYVLFIYCYVIYYGRILAYIYIYIYSVRGE